MLRQKLKKDHYTTATFLIGWVKVFSDLKLKLRQRVFWSEIIWSFRPLSNFEQIKFFSRFGWMNINFFNPVTCVVYFDQLSGAACTRMLVNILFLHLQMFFLLFRWKRIKKSEKCGFILKAGWHSNTGCLKVHMYRLKMAKDVKVGNLKMIISSTIFRKIVHP